LACRILNIGQLSPRAHKIEGIFPVQKTDEGVQDFLFHALENPFWALDSRSYQVSQVNNNNLNLLGGKILALEQSNTNDSAVMAIRFSPEMIGTQFHPEADADGWMVYVENKIRTDIEQQAGWESTLERAKIHHNALQKTHETLLPGFIKQAIRQIR
jgi:GMP synthase-like glutamine amidotransferase